MSQNTRLQQGNRAATRHWVIRRCGVENDEVTPQPGTKQLLGIAFQPMPKRKKPEHDSVDSFFDQPSQWRSELKHLRGILLDCGLDEAFKWSLPCYTYQGKNIVVLQPFKKYLALLFLKGALLQDTDGVLVKTGENAQAGRQIRFNSVKEITELEPILKTYLFQAIEVERSGLKVRVKPNDELDIPEELQTKFEESRAFKKAFDALTPGRQRGYIFYFAQPKQSKTRAARIEKYVPHIMEGKGINDDYLAAAKSFRER